MYSNKIFEIFKNPACAGGLQGSNGIGKYIDDNCGDYVKIYLKIDEKQTITEARFKTMGSVGTIVASSVLCDQLADLTLTEAQAITGEDILSITGEYPEDKKYSLDFAIRALNLAIADYFQKLEKEPKRKKTDKEQSEKQSKKTEEQTIEMPTVQEQTEALVKEEKVENITPSTEDSDYYDNFEDYLLFGDEQSADTMPEDKQTTIYVEPQKDIDPVDIFLRGETDNNLEVHTLANRDTLSISKVADESEFEVDEKAQKMVDDARSYTPIVETRIIRDEDIKREVPEKNETNEDKKVSKAKALFDSMFE